MRVRWPDLIERVERHGTDVARLCQVDRTTVWRWKSGDRKPGADNAVAIWEANRRIGNRREIGAQVVALVQHEVG